MLSTILLGNTKAGHPSAADPCSCARDADTIWGFTPEACDNITAMCRIYVPCVKHCSRECSCLPRRATMYYGSRLPPSHSARRLHKPDYSRGNASELRRWASMVAYSRFFAYYSRISSLDLLHFSPTTILKAETERYSPTPTRY
ncbi:hypothetical protein HZH68_016177 [Vespula germanica]|uniref:Uncharacterized protein n=1 Tax=Vespula germanica TaxID=30212 RepID=A0A834MQ92_VESGE|nr:hypothetical protein HZH68_016177 [Vespula germanica]